MELVLARLKATSPISARRSPSVSASVSARRRHRHRQHLRLDDPGRRAPASSCAGWFLTGIQWLGFALCEAVVFYALLGGLLAFVLVRRWSPCIAQEEADGGNALIDVVPG